MCSKLWSQGSLYHTVLLIYVFQTEMFMTEQILHRIIQHLLQNGSICWTRFLRYVTEISTNGLVHFYSQVWKKKHTSVVLRNSYKQKITTWFLRPCKRNVKPLTSWDCSRKIINGVSINFMATNCCLTHRHCGPWWHPASVSKNSTGFKGSACQHGNIQILDIWTFQLTSAHFCP